MKTYNFSACIAAVVIGGICSFLCYSSGELLFQKLFAAIAIGAIINLIAIMVSERGK